MQAASARRAKTPRPASSPRLLCLLFLWGAIASCASTGPRTVGGDVSREGFGAALTDGLLRIPERTVVYVSSADRALVWSRRIFRRARLGEMWAEELPPRTVDFLRANPSLELIDVTEAASSTTGNGHSYFRQSPWVSSDILALLAFDLDPAQRGLEKDADLLVWRFPPDYIERLQKSLVELRPDLAGASARQL